MAEAHGRYVQKVDSTTGLPDLVVITPGPDAPVYVVRTEAEMEAVLQRGDPVALVEVKMPNGKLKPKQKEFFDKSMGR